MTRLKPNKYREITAARKLLGLPETATMASIKASYRTLLAKWHPDKCREGKELCHQMTQKVIWAYKTIVDYCSNYEYSFTEQSIKRHLSPEEWWIDRFGDDPLWGRGTKSE
ncbi:MAG: J domain-containing protein [Deltaproteobacteria bacterium]|nr:MAG: J domain-containing protein [Deltaproteobacteria bacterium]